jgi:hypothetical protein
VGGRDGHETIWELVRQTAETLPEPFSRHALITWVSKRRPDVEVSSISTHIQYAIAETPNRERHSLGSRPPLLDRVDRGLYRRYRGGPHPAQVVAHVPAGTSGAAPAPAAATRIRLVGCSRTKASGPRPAAELFLGAGFGKARDYAMALGGPWYVLSAKYGLLHPDDVVAPYDVYLGDRPEGYRSAWGEWVVAQLADRYDLRGAVVEVHAGRAYVGPLAVRLTELGATLTDPLAGLRQGERLAWYGENRPSAPAEPVQADDAPTDVSWLLAEQNAVAPAEFLAAGRAVHDLPGLYSWWVDLPGAHALSAGLGHRVVPGLIYAGRAGGQRPDGRVSANTLWGRIGGMHLQGNRDFSTFRLTLTAALRHSGAAVFDEMSLTRWMHEHLRVAVLPLPAAAVFAAEERLLELTDPPLNLRGVVATPLRRTLSRLRSELSKET